MKNKSAALLKADSFYDEISDFYEKMIDFEKNLGLRVKAYQKIFPGKGKAADLGCGVGLDSLALAIDGHKVTAFDISQKMIAETKRNAIKYNVDITTHVHSFKSIPKLFNQKFNSVISVGNTIAHVNSKQLNAAIKKIYDILLPGGKIFLHILNYPLIKKENKRINNIANRDGKIIIRFYDFRKDDLNFNILSFQQNSPKEFQLVTTKHYPHTTNEIKSFLKGAGFNRIKFMKNFAGDKFTSGDSKDIFIAALKEL
jgi:glycine/sarcosine N-methyltransferase